MRLRIPINDGVANAGALSGPPLGVQVLIPAALNRPTHTLYSICMSVQPTLQEWTVNRRYSQFLTLHTDLITTLVGRRGAACPACASFALALRKFPFPRKAWLRSNRVVRQRVKALEGFLQLLVERLFTDLPKCLVCGEGVKKMVRPFLIRGAQPLGDSTVPKIQHSLSLQSYAIIKHRPRHFDIDTPEEDYDEQDGVIDKKKASAYPNDRDESYATTMRTTGSDPATDDERDSPTEQSVDFAASTRSEDSYGKQFDIEPRCTDTGVALEDALKQVVMNTKRKNTIEDVAFRLTTMWDAYSLDDTRAAAPQLGLRLSQSLEDDGSEDGMGMGMDTNATETEYDRDGKRDDVFDEDDDVIHMLEDDLAEDDENNVSFAVLQDDFEFDAMEELDDDARETLAVDTVSYAF